MSWLALSIGSFGRFRGFSRKLSEKLRDLGFDFFDPYQPERHYMRGPGPKWQERQRRS